jgi:hypothetical protein
MNQTSMNNENVDAVLPQPEQEEYTLEELFAELDRRSGRGEYTLEELMVELDRRWEQSHRQ